MINKLKKKNIKVSLFIEPKNSDIKLSKQLGASCIEIHTGRYCNLFNKKKNSKDELRRIKEAAIFAKENDLEVHAGHGLSYKTTYHVSKIKNITEFNIGHFIISESIFINLKNSIRRFKRIINK